MRKRLHWALVAPTLFFLGIMIMIVLPEIMTISEDWMPIYAFAAVIISVISCGLLSSDNRTEHLAIDYIGLLTTHAFFFWGGYL